MVYTNDYILTSCHYYLMDGAICHVERNIFLVGFNHSQTIFINLMDSWMAETESLNSPRVIY